MPRSSLTFFGAEASSVSSRGGRWRARAGADAGARAAGTAAGATADAAATGAQAADEAAEAVDAAERPLDGVTGSDTGPAGVSTTLLIEAPSGGGGLRGEECIDSPRAGSGRWSSLDARRQLGGRRLGVERLRGHMLGWPRAAFFDAAFSASSSRLGRDLRSGGRRWPGALPRGTDKTRSSLPGDTGSLLHGSRAAAMVPPMPLVLLHAACRAGGALSEAGVGVGAAAAGHPAEACAVGTGAGVRSTAAAAGCCGDADAAGSTSARALGGATAGAAAGATALLPGSHVILRGGVHGDGVPLDEQVVPVRCCVVRLSVTTESGDERTVLAGGVASAVRVADLSTMSTAAAAFGVGGTAGTASDRPTSTAGLSASRSVARERRERHRATTPTAARTPPTVSAVAFSMGN